MNLAHHKLLRFARDINLLAPALNGFANNIGDIHNTINKTWSALNNSLFKGELTQPRIQYFDQYDPFAHLDPSLVPTLWLSKLWLWYHWRSNKYLMRLLTHEMIHQYVWEILGSAEFTAALKDKSGHGEAFRDVANSIGVDASSLVPKKLMSKHYLSAFGNVSNLVA